MIDRKGKKRKGKGKTNGTGQGSPPETCSRGACRASYSHPSQGADREWCEFICAQCDGDDPREFCIIGERHIPVGASCCEVGQACCSGYCIDPFSNDRHCGACNRRCSPGKVCFGGECLCQDDLTLCGAVCLDTRRDERNRGSCRNQCGANEACVDGACVCEDGRPHCVGRCCDADAGCLNELVCCPNDDIGPVCPGDGPNLCRPDVSIVCCDGFACSIGQNDPAGYFCHGRSPSNGTCSPIFIEGAYAPLATHRYGT